MSAKHALIIDDKETNIEVLGMLLANEGVTHVGMTSEREVLAALGTLEVFDLIFLDLEMTSGGDYYFLLDTLRAQPELEGVPIIAYTVHISEIEKARRAGFDHFLGKPLRTRDFPEQLRRILNGEPVWVY